MSKDEALDKWLEAELPMVMGESTAMACNEPVQAWLDRVVARAAWHAAVKHTLAFVADELGKQATVIGSPSAWCMQDFVNFVKKMKP